jgi:putative peptide zinc metalloprotease protein
MLPSSEPNKGSGTDLCYVFNPRIRLTPVDQTDKIAKVLCEVPDRQGRVGRFVFSGALIGILRLFNGRRTLGEVVAAYTTESADQACTFERVERFVNKFCLPRGILMEDEKSDFEGTAGPGRRYLTGRFPLLPTKLVAPFARRLAGMFRAPIAFALTLIALLAHVTLYYRWIAGRTAVQSIGPAAAVVVIVIAIIAAFWHEFGHASALARYSGEKVEIGFGVYLYMPVLYTDVSEAWRFSRPQRMAVDIGGIYFSSLAATVTICAFYATHDAVWFYATLLVDLSIAYSFNPFLRMDGYWLLVDALGIWNLQPQSVLTLKNFLGPNRYGREDALGTVKTEGKKIRLAFLAYVVLGLCFWLCLSAVLVHRLVRLNFAAYPDQLRVLVGLIGASKAGIAAIFLAIVKLGWAILILICAVGFGWRVIRSSYSLIARLSETKASVVGNAEPDPRGCDEYGFFVFR